MNYSKNSFEGQKNGSVLKNINELQFFWRKQGVSYSCFRKMFGNYIFWFLFIQCVEGKMWMPGGSMKSFHCSKNPLCETQNLFGICPADHPFAFNGGKMCCDCQNEKDDKV